MGGTAPTEQPPREATYELLLQLDETDLAEEDLLLWEPTEPLFAEAQKLWEIMKTAMQRDQPNPRLPDVQRHLRTTVTACTAQNQATMETQQRQAVQTCRQFVTSVIDAYVESYKETMTEATQPDE